MMNGEYGMSCDYKLVYALCLKSALVNIPIVCRIYFGKAGIMNVNPKLKNIEPRTMNSKTAKTKLLFALFILLSVFVRGATAQETKLKWHGHSAFSLTTPNGKVLLIDPWIKNPSNPETKDGRDPLAGVTKVDYILLTHGHRDHVGDAVEIARRTGAALISNPELAGNLVKLADFPSKRAETDAIMGIGGEIQIADGEVTVAMTPAIHSSSVFNPKAGASEPERVYGGNPAGFVIIIKNGPTIYHSGDTAYFKDMETIGESYAIDVALLNIGGHFGMEPRMAAKAAQVMHARLAVPHHFGTFPGISQNADGFAAELKRTKIDFYEIKPGATISFRGKQLVRAK
ncbi:MAG TPA: metal-dependent hydrolase [Pyrinomonadaceae bacterium]|nr:metal-dependent hydrolase [Pyrinomonadaceae bacterium]